MSAEINVEVGDHSVLDKFPLHKIARQLDRLLALKLGGQCKFDLPRQLRVPALLGGFDRVPQLLPSAHPRRGVRRHSDFRNRGAAAGLGADMQAEPAVIKPLPASPRGHGDGALPFGAAHDSYA